MPDTYVSAECAACGNGNARLVSRSGYFPFANCTHCGMRTIFPPDRLADLSVEQDEDAYIASYSGTLSSVVAKRVQYVEARLSPGSSILDFGAGFGHIARGLAARHYKVITLEKSSNAALSMRRAGMRVVHDLDALYGERFDAIAMWHVLEHIERPLDLLEVLKNLLNPGGRFFIAVPNAEGLFARASWEHWVWTLPWHLHYFTRSSLSRILQRAGLEVRSIHDGTGDVAALECAIGESLLRKPSRLTTREYVHAQPYGDASMTRRFAKAVLRPASRLIQEAARAVHLGEEMIAHAAIPDNPR